MAHLEPLMRRNFLEYASYVIVDRAIPDLRDGFKPVQRRILATLRAMHDGRFHKVANVIGDTMKLHPHGETSIGDALVTLANKDYFIERQGNYGSVITGHGAAAPRYIECRLTPLALETLFHPELTETIPSYDGRKMEPVALPAKLPVVLLLGAEGIAVGMTTRVLPHNFGELLEAQIALLQKKPIKLLPDFPQGGVVDVSEYDNGKGKVRIRAKIEADGDKEIVITEIPYGTTTESLVASIESAAQKNKVKIGSIQDYTTDKVEIRIALPRGVHADETIPQLFAYTDCEVSLTSAVTVIRDRHPADLGTDEILAWLTDELKARIKLELEHELGLLEDRRHTLTLERIFIEKGVWRDLEKAKTDESVRETVWKGMRAHKKLWARDMVEEDVTRLPEIRIRRISAYDIEKYKQQMDEIDAEISDIQKRLRSLVKTTIAYLQDLIKRYASRWPRRTKVAGFDTVDLKEVARAHIRVSYDAESGFWGSGVKGADHHHTMSEYDKVLLVSSDGTYRIVGPEEKVLVPGKLVWCAPFDPEAGQHAVVVYRDKGKMCFGKRIQIKGFVRGREYRLIKDAGGTLDLFVDEQKPGEVHLRFVHKARQRVAEATFDLDELEVTSPGAKGRRLAPKPVARVKRLSGKGR